MRERKALRGPHSFGDQSISIQPQEQRVSGIDEGDFVENNELGSSTVQPQDGNVNSESRSSIVHEEECKSTCLVPETDE